MKGKIGLEEHFAIAETLEDSERYFNNEVWPEFSKKILDLMKNRINEMDYYGMEMMILFYMHPREPMPCNMQIYKGHPWLEGAAWAFGVETATHTLRLMCSGIFDKYPKLKLLYGQKYVVYN